MQSDEGETYAETFIIWNDDINLIGTLKPSNEEISEICGSIKFRNGKNLSFISPPADRRALRKRFVSLCRCIARFYGTEVIHSKSLPADMLDEAFLFSHKNHHSLN